MPQPDLTQLNTGLAEGMMDVLTTNVQAAFPPALAPVIVGEVVGLMAAKFVEQNPSATEGFRLLVNSLIDIAEARA